MTSPIDRNSNSQISSRRSSISGEPSSEADYQSDEDIVVSQLGEANIRNIRIVLPGSGAYRLIPVPEDKQDQLQKLYEAFAGGGTLDLSSMTRTLPDGTIEELGEHEIGKIRDFVGAILQGKSKTPYVWRQFHTGSRSSYTMDFGLSWTFSQRPSIDVEALLKQGSLGSTELPSPMERLMRRHLSKLLSNALRNGVEAVHGEIKGRLVPDDQKLKLQGYLKKVAAVQEQLKSLNELALEFEALLPLDTPNDEEALKEKEKLARALFKLDGQSIGAAAKDKTLSFGKSVIKNLPIIGIAAQAVAKCFHQTWFDAPPKTADLEAACKQLALIGIEGRINYERARGFLDAPARRDSMEHLISRLAATIVDGKDVKPLLSGGLFQDLFGDLEPNDATLLCKQLCESCTWLQQRALRCKCNPFPETSDVSAMEQAVKAAFVSDENPPS